MAKETQIGKLVVELQAKTEALESGLKVAQNKLKEIEDANKKVESSNKSVDASWIAVAATATAALAGIKSAISAAVDEYKSYTQAMESLADVSDYTNQNMSDMTKVMNKYSSIMNKSDLATTIKNFSLMGMTVEQTDQMIESLTNSAIRNRNANYTVSEAVKVASDGYRQGLSTLSDSAGVTENLSVMLDNYAKSIGKTASKLTEAEKNQAYLNRTMYAAEPFAGAMEGYLESLAGKQGLYAQSMRDTQVAFAEALEPTLSMILSIGTQVLGVINSFISDHPNITTAITVTAVTLSILTLAVVAVKKAIDLYSNSAFKATLKTNGLTAAIFANPFGMLAVAISAVIGVMVGLTGKIKEQTAAQKELNEQEERYQKIKEGTYGTDKESFEKAKQDYENISRQVKLFEQLAKKEEEANEKAKEVVQSTSFLEATNEVLNKNTEAYNGLNQAGQNITSPQLPTEEFKELNVTITETIDNYRALQGVSDGYHRHEVTGFKNTAGSLKKLKQEQQDYAKYLSKNTLDQINKSDTIKQHQKEAAQLKANVSQMQEYLKVIKTADKSSTEYKKAVEELAKEYPEAASAGGILENVIEGLINDDSLKADSAWQSAKEEINSYISVVQAALDSEETQVLVAQAIGISVDELNEKLRTSLALYQNMANYKPEEVPGITPITAVSSGGSSSYSNEALDNYKKQIEHKKALDQITLKEEIAMYETALREYANTADEKMELREKIYELNKELAKKEQEILEQQTEDYENYIQEQKNLRGAAYDVVEQTRDYDKIIRMHKNYLEQIMKDERLSLEERKEIYREELQTIRDYEQQKRDLRVEAVDNTVSQLTSAITKQLEEAQKKDKEAIDKNLEEVERWKNARIDAINEEYDARIEAINKELEALDKAEEQKSREEEDAEFERKKLRLEQLIAYEHDTTTRANYQKELDKLVAEYQKTLDNRALQDKKDALNEQKELLQKEQDDMTQSVEDEADRQKEVYDKQLEDLEKYYEEQIDMAQETAEKMLLNVGQNQDKILNLLKSYGDKYEITGQTLGEKLAQGINDGLSDKIQNMVQKIQDTIDANLNSKIKEWTASNYRYEEGQDKPITQTITVNQTNNIEQLPELPSETYRKLNNISENLAAELSGV